MAALSVVVMALMLFGHVHATCPGGQRLAPGGGCLPPVIINENTNPTLESGAIGENFFVFKGGSAVSLDPRQAVSFEWKGYRAGIFVVEAYGGSYGGDIWFTIYENGQFVYEINVGAALGSGEFSLSFEPSSSGYDRGLWRVVAVNWGSTTQSAAFGSPLSFYLSCQNGDTFGVNPYTNYDKTCLVPKCPDDTILTNNECVYNPCTDPNEHRLANGVCAAPNLAQGAPGVHWLTAADNGSVDKEAKLEGEFGIGNPVSLTYSAGGAVLELSSYRADTLKVTIPSQSSGKVFVRVYENGKLVPGGEYIPTGATKTFTATKPDGGQKFGAWTVAVVNYDRVSQNFSPATIAVWLSCGSGSDFSGTDVLSCLVAPPPPPPATTCAYTSAVGFNVWSRWNIFTLGDVELDGGSIEGRVAAVGTVEVLNSGMVHTRQEAFISTKENAANGGPWSITAKGAVTLTSASGAPPGGITVLNGGVESQSTITKVGVVVADDKEAPDLSKLSADVDAAAAYFTVRSDEWNGLAPTSIATNISASEIRVQLHGKVNVVTDAATLTTLSFAGIEKITLTGHPLGTLIINVAGVGKAVLSPNLKVTYQARGASSAEPLTFGRVVLNFNAAAEIELPGGASPSIDVSILAPKAAAVFRSGAPKVRGNVVALSLAASNDLDVLPFGTRAVSSGNPAPRRKFTPQGKYATACLWHTL